MAEKRPVLIVVAGPNGSGKTSLTEAVLRHQWMEGCTYINPDVIAQERFGDWNSDVAVMQAARFAADERERCLGERISLAFESVLSAPDKVDFVARAKAQGFFVRVFFVGTDHPSINAARVAQRVMEGGHAVPIPKIISRYSKSIAHCAAVASLADRAYVYDNSVDGAAPRLMFKAVDGAVSKQYSPINAWAIRIAASLPHTP